MSQPFEELYDEERGDFDQKLLRKRLKELSLRYRVSEPTEFKFLLGRAEPSFQINDRLWKVLDNHPELYVSVLRYFQRYERLPTKAGDRLVAALAAVAKRGWPAILRVPGPDGISMRALPLVSRPKV